MANAQDASTSMGHLLIMQVKVLQGMQQQSWWTILATWIPYLWWRNSLLHRSSREAEPTTNTKQASSLSGFLCSHSEGSWPTRYTFPGLGLGNWSCSKGQRESLGEAANSRFQSSRGRGRRSTSNPVPQGRFCKLGCLWLCKLVPEGLVVVWLLHCIPLCPACFQSNSQASQQ